MPSTHYRRGKEYAISMSLYAQQMSQEEDQEMDRLKRNLLLALREDVTPRQRQLLLLYYGEGLTMQNIAQRLKIDRSTVSRTILRGERRLQRCLRYGADRYLRSCYPEHTG